MKEKIQKIDLIYLLEYIFVPVAICALCYTICYTFFNKGGTGAVLTTLVPTLLAIIWWIFGGTIIFKMATKNLIKNFKSSGYTRNQTFYGRGKTVVLDVDKGMFGITFFWNPFIAYILPASRISKAWVDDGKMGSGLLEGSSRVSFLCMIDDIKIRVDTFTSNQRFRMDDKRILTGISKADLMVNTINEAKQNSKESSKSTSNLKKKPTSASEEPTKESKDAESPKKSTETTKKPTK